LEGFGLLTVRNFLWDRSKLFGLYFGCRDKAEKEQSESLYRGISARPFKRQFNLADYVQVKNATFENGLLRVELAREVPEAMKPRRIAINGATPSNVHQLDGKAA
jgi:molecular chaperone IbpA